MRRIPLTLMIVVLFVGGVALIGCSSKPKYQIGDYIMPIDKSDPSKILKVVGVENRNYKVFTHFISNGRLVQAEDYQTRNKKEIEKTFVKIEPPRVEDIFSPDKYLNMKTNPLPQQ